MRLSSKVIVRGDSQLWADSTGVRVCDDSILVLSGAVSGKIDYHLFTLPLLVIDIHTLDI